MVEPLHKLVVVDAGVFVAVRGIEQRLEVLVGDRAVERVHDLEQLGLGDRPVPVRVPAPEGPEDLPQASDLAALDADGAEHLGRAGVRQGRRRGRLAVPRQRRGRRRGRQLCGRNGQAPDPGRVAVRHVGVVVLLSLPRLIPEVGVKHVLDKVLAPLQMEPNANCLESGQAEAQELLPCRPRRTTSRVDRRPQQASLHRLRRQAPHFGLARLLAVQERDGLHIQLPLLQPLDNLPYQGDRLHAAFRVPAEVAGHGVGQVPDLRRLVGADLHMLQALGQAASEGAPPAVVVHQVPAVRALVNLP
mmetsp:Transcript_37183/g.104922  ORF Transcript_37183/g.104922 Transcript_37183/m.104922 type:complete len:303 (-) Transcript_37183:98-1006(-)